MIILIQLYHFKNNNMDKTTPRHSNSVGCFAKIYIAIKNLIIYLPMVFGAFSSIEINRTNRIQSIEIYIGKFLMLDYYFMP